jgi:DNA-binding transcriptional regulator YiaG
MSKPASARRANPTPVQIKAARTGAKLTQVQAAALVEAAPRTLQDWEGGRRRMHPIMWDRFQLEISKLLI